MKYICLWKKTVQAPSLQTRDGDVLWHNFAQNIPKRT